MDPNFIPLHVLWTLSLLHSQRLVFVRISCIIDLLPFFVQVLANFERMSSPASCLWGTCCISIESNSFIFLLEPIRRIHVSAPLWPRIFLKLGKLPVENRCIFLWPSLPMSLASLWSLCTRFLFAQYLNLVLIMFVCVFVLRLNMIACCSICVYATNCIFHSIVHTNSSN